MINFDEYKSVVTRYGFTLKPSVPSSSLREFRYIDISSSESLAVTGYLVARYNIKEQSITTWTRHGINDYGPTLSDDGIIYTAPNTPYRLYDIADFENELGKFVLSWKSLIKMKRKKLITEL